MSTEAEQDLLSLLEKVSHPLKSLTIKAKVRGVFCPPEQWYRYVHVGKLWMKSIRLFSPTVSTLLVVLSQVAKSNLEK